ncbi:Gfo/Idh/MocA family protein [Parasediminibacterium sp. JCM 36343]|uniref:Gfo/Idh/MocA family protein n=1 Tax=Parasediminibacterium sp. JCM 36343 TaxID=3374279 RepID=UPI00397B33F5
MERRSFIKNGGAIAGGLLFHNKMLQALTINKADEKINIAVIGCGERGKGIISILNELENLFQLVAVCDVLDFRFDEVKKMITANYKTYKDYKGLLDNKNIQAVIIATPLYLHFEIAKAAILAGKNVYLEKTMTYDIPQALELVSLVQTHKKQVLQVGHQYRYAPLYYKVKEMIDNDYLGKVTQIDCRWDRNVSWRRPVPQPGLERQINWRMYKAYSGGLVAELLSHQIDFVNWAFNTHPDEIFATGGIDNYKDGRETYDNVQAVLRYNKEGMIGNFGATCSNERDGYLFKIKGTKGTVDLLMHEGVYYPEKKQQKELQTVDGVTGSTKIEWNKDGGIPILTEPAKDGTWYALTSFYKCITTQQVPDSNVITGATTAIAVHLANEALYNHTITQWKPSYQFQSL